MIRQNAALGQLAVEVGHELNNVLGAAVGYLQLAKEEQDLPARGEDYLNRIEERLRQATSIARELQEFGSPLFITPDPVDINHLLEEALDLLRVRSPLEGITIDLHLNPNQPPILGDPVRLSQTILNLLINAQEALPEGGVVQVASRYIAGKVQVLVADNGIGIASEDLPYIFEPFFTTKAEKGRGLGLAICQRVIEEHGGRIEVESKPGKGTRFVVSLPVSKVTTSSPHRIRNVPIND
ncbi:MAG: hypothetical protein HYX86_05570 [Chloroflexi bacterium]|nr:hypothetical protein [Chloroflexota bacterium]